VTVTSADLVAADALFGEALRGTACHLVVAGGRPLPLPVAAWDRPVDGDDEVLLELCSGPTLDVGCGPGRLVAALVARGATALGIDLAAEAVAQTLARGAPALRRDVFGPLPGEGTWGTALLADGNLGIGGDPLGLLLRLRRVVAPTGLVVTEIAGPGVPTASLRAHLRCGELRSAEFGWSVIGVDGLPELAADAGLTVRRLTRSGSRWFATLGSSR